MDSVAVTMAVVVAAAAGEDQLNAAVQEHMVDQEVAAKEDMAEITAVAGGSKEAAVKADGEAHNSSKEVVAGDSKAAAVKADGEDHSNSSKEAGEVLNKEAAAVAGEAKASSKAAGEVNPVLSSGLMLKEETETIKLIP